jgi:GNAT superfamily N-acetyltransferase
MPRGKLPKVRTTPLTEETLRDAPEWEAHPWSCKYCLYWEHPELLVDPETESRAQVFEHKLAWVRRAREECGECGRILYVHGKAVGYAQYAPASFLPNAASYPAGPVSADAVFLSCLFIPARADRGQGWGSVLLRDTLDALRLHGTKAVETFARRGSAENPSGPVEFYLRHGFHVHRDDPQFPLLRIPFESG